MKNSKYNELTQKAISMVMARIEGERKGMPGSLNYIHSLRVGNLLRVYKFDHETILAGFLHDVVEDGGVTFEELEQVFPKEVVQIVRLCTHDSIYPQKDRRWIIMVIGLAKADSRSAWAVKLADAFDNLMDAHTLLEERETFLREVKIPVLLSASEHLLKETGLWDDLNSVAWKTTKMIGEIGGRVRYVKYEIEAKLTIPDNARTVLVALCNEIDKLNHGVSSAALRKAIEDLHDIAITYAQDKSVADAKSLELLANGLCGDMLAHWEVGNEIAVGYKAINKYVEYC
jgi:hypothetical protein